MKLKLRKIIVFFAFFLFFLKIISLKFSYSFLFCLLEDLILNFNFFEMVEVVARSVEETVLPEVVPFLESDVSILEKKRIVEIFPDLSLASGEWESRFSEKGPLSTVVSGNENAVFRGVLGWDYEQEPDDLSAMDGVDYLIMSNTAIVEGNVKDVLASSIFVQVPNRQEEEGQSLVRQPFFVEKFLGKENRTCILNNDEGVEALGNFMGTRLDRQKTPLDTLEHVIGKERERGRAVHEWLRFCPVNANDSYDYLEKMLAAARIGVGEKVNMVIGESSPVAHILRILSEKWVDVEPDPTKNPFCFVSGEYLANRKVKEYTSFKVMNPKYLEATLKEFGNSATSIVNEAWTLFEKNEELNFTKPL